MLCRDLSILGLPNPSRRRLLRLPRLLLLGTRRELSLRRARLRIPRGLQPLRHLALCPRARRVGYDGLMLPDLHRRRALMQLFLEASKRTLLGRKRVEFLQKRRLLPVERRLRRRQSVA